MNNNEVVDASECAATLPEVFMYTSTMADGSIVHNYYAFINGEVVAIDNTIPCEEGVNKYFDINSELSVNEKTFSITNSDLLGEDDENNICPDQSGELPSTSMGIGEQLADDILDEMVMKLLRDKDTNDSLHNNIKIKVEENAKKPKCRKKRKLYDVTEPLSDEEQEKKRQNAVNAKKNRDRKNSEFDAMKEELAKKNALIDELQNQLAMKTLQLENADLKRENAELKYKALQEKFSYHKK